MEDRTPVVKIQFQKVQCMLSTEFMPSGLERLSSISMKKVGDLPFGSTSMARHEGKLPVKISDYEEGIRDIIGASESIQFGLLQVFSFGIQALAGVSYVIEEPRDLGYMIQEESKRAHQELLGLAIDKNENDGRSTMYQDCIIAKQVILGLYHDLDYLESLLSEDALPVLLHDMKRTRLNGEEYLIVSVFPRLTDAIELSLNSNGEAKVWHGFPNPVVGVSAATYLIVTSNLKGQALPDINRATNLMFQLELGAYHLGALEQANRLSGALVESLPLKVGADLRKSREVLRFLIDLNEHCSELRRVQLLANEWHVTNGDYIDSTLSFREVSDALFDEEYISLLAESFAPHRIKAAERLLERRLDVFEKTLQRSTDIVGSQLDMMVARGFDVVSLILSCFVVFEVIATFLSWRYLSPQVSDPQIEVYWLILGLVLLSILAVIYLRNRSLLALFTSNRGTVGRRF